MGKTIKLAITGILLVLLIPLISATPGIPHWFYGDVEVNGQAVPDNNIIVATVGEDSYTTVTKDSKYGYAPNTFYVEDPEGNRKGDTIEFYIGGMKAKSYIFENNGYTKIDFALTTNCGDGYCLGDETCSSCSNDCGICTDLPIITIDSPINTIYDTLKINLDVYSDQNIILWLYNLNNKGFVTFAPNIILTVQEGENNIIVEGRNENGQYGSSTVSFSVDLGEYCGDTICNNAETCSTCPGDCGACPVTNTNTGGGGGGSSSSSSSTTPTLTTTSTGNSDNQNTGENNEESDLGLFETTEQEPPKNFFSRITGAVVGGGRGKYTIPLVFIILIVVIAIGIYVKRKS